MADIIYEDNHLLIVSKCSGEIVQGDKTKDKSLIDSLKLYIKEKYNKPGNVFLGLVNRLDRPVSGLVVFAKTSKSLTRMNELFRKSQIEKVYWAIVTNKPPRKEDTLKNWIVKNEKQNKSYLVDKNTPGAKEAILTYRYMSSTEKYHLLEIKLKTGRHHQIRCQLANIGCHIKGDLKYGAPRSNKNGGISLLSRYISFEHPTKKELISLSSPFPKDDIWEMFFVTN